MESAATGTPNDITRPHNAIQSEQAISQGFSPGLGSQPPLGPPSEDDSSRETPPPLGASSSSTEDWARETQQSAGTPPPPLDTISYSYPTISGKDPPVQAKLVSPSSPSSVKNRIWSSKPLDTTPPGRSPSSSLDIIPLKERELSSTPSLMEA